MRSSDSARLEELFRESQAQLWLFQSGTRTCGEFDVASLRLVHLGWPGSYPGLSLVVSVHAHSPELAATLVHLRDLFPLFPVVCLLPAPSDVFGREVLRLCGALRMRWAHEPSQEKPSVSVLEELLRREPARFGLEVISFLSARGHAIAPDGFLGLARAIWRGATLEQLGPTDATRRKEWICTWRRRLRRASLPPFRELVSGLRVVAAGVLLIPPKRPSVEDVAEKLGFSGEPALSKAMLNRLNVRPTEVGDFYPFEWMLDRAVPTRVGRKEVRRPRSLRAAHVTFSPWLHRRAASSPLLPQRPSGD